VLAKTIKVNDPLVYKGIWFYQSSYGDAWNHLEQAQVRVSDNATGRIFRDVVLDWQKEAALADLGLRMTLTDFVADFAFNPYEKTVYSKSTVHRNPAVKITITEGDRIRAERWLLFAFPDLVQVQDSKYHFEVVGYTPKKFTGLQITKDPGVGLVWAGSTMLVVGVTLSAFIYHRRIWVKLLSSPAGTSVVWGGTSHKSRIDFLREFNRISEDIKKL
jgi:cytochrome c biogenesis protein